MSLRGDTDRLRAVAAVVRDLGLPTGQFNTIVAAGVGTAVREHLRVEQFGKGIGPDGSPWRLTKGRKPALVSKKLPQDFKSDPVPGGVEFSGRIAWMETHQKGHTFPARSQSALVAVFNRKGEQVKYRNAFRASVKAGARYEAEDGGGRLVKLTKRGRDSLLFSIRAGRDHTVGARVLPRRPIYPESTVPAAWGDAINRGIEIAINLYGKTYNVSPPTLGWLRKRGHLG